MPGLIYDTLTQGLGRVLDLRAQQHALTTANLANAETPNFKAKVLDFQNALGQALEFGTPRGSSAGPSPRIEEIEPTPWTTNGNSGAPRARTVAVAGQRAHVPGRGSRRFTPTRHAQVRRQRRELIMDLLDTFNIAGSGMAAQRVRLHTISANLANARTTRTEEGGPYQRRAPVFVAEPLTSFGDALDREMASVRIESIDTQPRIKMVHDPQHPDAGPDGYVAMPDIDVLAEMVDLLTTSRAFEANVGALEATRDMALGALDIGR